MANALTSGSYFWPNYALLMPAIPLVATVLAAVLERPFVVRAGVREHALSYALRANFLSLAAGYLLLPLGFDRIARAGLPWLLVDLGVSVVCEGWYYQRRALRGTAELRWGWVVLGNAVSTTVLLLVPPPVMWARRHGRR